jgi:hypothetical protein
MDDERSADQLRPYRVRRDQPAGETVGYHHRPDGVDPPEARVVRVGQPPDSNGVYRARLTLRDPANGTWVPKARPP